MSSSEQQSLKERDRPGGFSPDARKKLEAKRDRKGNLIRLRHKKQNQFICRRPISHPVRHRRTQCKHCVRVSESALVMHYYIDAVGKGGVIKPPQVETLIKKVRATLNIGEIQVRNVFRELSDKELVFHTNIFKGYISTQFTTLYHYLVPYSWHHDRELPQELTWAKWGHPIQVALLLMLVRYGDNDEMSSARYDAIYDLLKPTYKKIIEEIRDIPTKKERISRSLKALTVLKYRKNKK